jgi:hypothetical protein
MFEMIKTNNIFYGFIMFMYRMNCVIFEIINLPIIIFIFIH